MDNEERAQELFNSICGNSTKSWALEIAAALDAAEERALEDVTLALDKATPLTNGADAPSRIEWLLSRIEDAEDDRTKVILDCIKALKAIRPFAFIIDAIETLEDML